MGRLSGAQLLEFRRLADATAPFVIGKRFSDVTRYAQANHAFHLFLIEASRNAPLIALYKQLAVQDYIGRALRDDIEIVGDIVQQHRDLVNAFEYGDMNAAREIIAQHALHSKATMSRALGKKSAPAAVAPAPEPEPTRCPFSAMVEQPPTLMS
ncbi:FCD domain-containing protein [Pseudocitrobacter faecalis]|nr:FCD domain-containing protein [Pseudocitrobacter faecalis]